MKIFKAADQEKIRRRIIDYPEFRELYIKYTLPKWYKEISEEAIVDILSKSLNHDFGSHYITVDGGVLDEGTPFITVTYGNIGKLTSRYAFYGQKTIDVILNELIYLQLLTYGEERVREVINEFLESEK